MDITRFTNQTATYTTPGTDDGFGNKTGGVASTIDVRWVSKFKLVADMEKKEVISTAMVISENILEIGGSLALTGGTSEQEGIIIAIESSPSVDGGTLLNKAYIR